MIDQCEGFPGSCTNAATRTVQGFRFCAACARAWAGYTPEAIEPEERMMSETREQLAAYAHEAWSGWMRYMFGKCGHTTEHQVVIPDSLVRRWMRQMNTAYADLPEEEKASDRKEADQMLAIVHDPAMAALDSSAPLLDRLAVLLSAARAWRDGAGEQELRAAIAALDEERP